jgi:flavin-dependent dehydrogenase
MSLEARAGVDVPLFRLIRRLFMKHPVVVGSSFAGLLISHRLARAGIYHLLVGKRPDFHSLRIGESLDFAGTWLLKENFGHLSRFFHRKDQVFALGARGQVLRFDTNSFLADRIAHLLLRGGIGLRNLDFRLIHLDRQGFDGALYDEVIANPHVRRIEADVEAVTYDHHSDRIVELTLHGGARVEPSVVFDATFHRRLIAEAAGVRREDLGGPRVAVFTHLYAVEKNREPANEWEVSTSVLNFGRSVLPPGVEGQGWCIPFRNHVSIGLSILPPNASVSPEELVGQLLEAFKSRGINVVERFPQKGPIVSVPHQYFTHARAAGANWLLAGGACTQIHFFSSTGVTTALGAAEIAVEFLKNPKSAQRYESFLRGLVGGHPIFDEIEERGKNGEISLPLLRRWVRSVFLRTWSCFTISRVPRRRMFANAIYRVFASQLYPIIGRHVTSYYSLTASPVGTGSQPQV